jgi:rod shape-determining protein MreC
METVLGRYRNLIILVGVLFLQVLGLAVQVKRSADAQNTRLIRIWAVDAITPFERAFVRVQDGAVNLWHSYFYLRGVRAENRELKQQIEEMRLKQVRLNEDAEQAHRLQSLLAFKEQYIEKTVAAQVIGSCGSDLSRCVYVDKGSNDGIRPDMAVITAGGIVGKILKVYDSTSQVLMINDQSSGAGVLLEKSRLQGVLRGTPNGELMLERIMSDESVSPGESVLSSGGDQIFPKGLPVGTVTSVKPGKEMFLSIKVKPAADLNRVEEVLVVTEKHERQPEVEATGVHVRAADILAKRLPSVPDKPPAPTQAGSATAVVAANPAAAAKAETNNAAVPKTISSGPAGALSPSTPTRSNGSASPPKADTVNSSSPEATTVSASKPTTSVVDPSTATKPPAPINPPSPNTPDDPH